MFSARGAAVNSAVYAVFFFNDTATTEIYTLSLHDALPILFFLGGIPSNPNIPGGFTFNGLSVNPKDPARSEEHTSELQSQSNLVCRLLLEKKKYARLLHPCRNDARQLHDVTRSLHCG